MSYPDTYRNGWPYLASLYEKASIDRVTPHFYCYPDLVLKFIPTRRGYQSKRSLTVQWKKVDCRMCPNYSPAGLGPFLSFSRTQIFYQFILFSDLI